jgi:hypothetical protein
MTKAQKLVILPMSSSIERARQKQAALAPATSAAPMMGFVDESKVNPRQIFGFPLFTIGLLGPTQFGKSSSSAKAFCNRATKLVEVGCSHGIYKALIIL